MGLEPRILEEGDEFKTQRRLNGNLQSKLDSPRDERVCEDERDLAVRFLRLSLIPSEVPLCFISVDYTSVRLLLCSSFYDPGLFDALKIIVDVAARLSSGGNWHHFILTVPLTHSVDFSTTFQLTLMRVLL